MTDNIINTINKYVAPEDTIYFLGDFSFADHKKIPELRARIACQNIVLIRGNHDHHINKYKDSFQGVYDVFTASLGKQQIFLSHYAHRVWAASHRGVWHLYGHSHGTIPDFGKSMDVGIDVAYKMFGEYRPFNLEEIKSIMITKEIAYVDHHVDANVE